MSAEKQGPESSPEGVGIGTDPVAMALALGSASRNESEAFLRDQRTLIAAQLHHLHEQLKQMHLDIWEKWLGVLLRVATLMVGLAAVTCVGLVVWDAVHSRGLIIESFNVPPDMAAQGLSGQVVATRLQDKLTALQDATDSSRAPQSYANNWGDNIKVEIPDTGISIGELQSFIKDWLGHDMRITGEIFHTSAGFAVTARAGSLTGKTFTGAETELDGLLQQAAEQVYADTQPYRYANFLDRDRSPVGLAERRARASAIYQQLSQSSDMRERAWALNGLGTQAVSIPSQGNRIAADYYRKAIAVWPDFTVGHYALAYRLIYLDQRESELMEFRTAARLLRDKSETEVHPKAAPLMQGQADGEAFAMTGDFADALRMFGTVADSHVTIANGSYRLAQSDAALTLEMLHDDHGARAYMLDVGLTNLPSGDVHTFLIDAMRGDWAALSARWLGFDDDRRKSVPRDVPAIIPAVAMAIAHLGDIQGAEAVVAISPPDCDGCLLARGKIAEMRGEHARADWWFARAVARTPSIPFASCEWGQALLARGEPDLAIEKFKLSNQKGPHFADPLEGWGEALMKKNQSHLALAKFTEAEKYAPNWGRLHLKWGEALYYAGKKDEAAKQFTSAASLDLTAAEKAELAEMNRG